MIGKGLSLDQAPPLHLPLRFFLTAPLFGMTAGLLLAWKGALLLLTPFAMQTVALAHLISLGFITMVMVGALYQIFPVLVGSPVPRVGLARVVHLGLVVGLLAMEVGLLFSVRPLLWVALAAFLSAFLIFFCQLSVALAGAPSLNPTVASIGLALSSLVVSVLLGLLFVGEHALGWFPLDRQVMLTIHIYLALGGWVGPLITGVGYALIPMFYLGAAFPARHAWTVLVCQGLVVVCGPLVALLAPSARWHLFPVCIAAVGVGVFSHMVWRSLAQRKRRITDATLRFWQLGIFAAPLSLMAVAGLFVRFDQRWLFVFGILFLLGFAAAIINGMLYKIVAFLVWLHRFSKLAGKVHVPLLRDIISPRQTLWQLWSYLAMLGLVLAAAATTHDGLARLAGLALTVTFGWLFLIVLGAARFHLPTAHMKPLAPSPVENGGGT